LVIEGVDFVGDGEVFIGDGVVGDLLWRSQILELSEFRLRAMILGAVGEFFRSVLAASVVGDVVGAVFAAGRVARRQRR